MNLPDAILNDEINATHVRLIDEEGQQLGIVSKKDAMIRAKNAGLDLMLISDKSDPPVCKILDYSKFAYEQKKKAKEQAKKARENAVEIKELRFGPNTAKHDLEIKIKHAKKFLFEGDKVKFVVEFHGREVTHMDKGKILLDSVLNELRTMIEFKVEKEVQQSGRNLHIIITSGKK